MNNRRELVIALGASALAAPFGSFAQQPGKVWRVGLLSQRVRPDSLDSDVIGAFYRGMRDLRYIDGKTAKALGLTIPQSLLISADKVIE